MMWAVLLIFGAEMIAMRALERKYMREGEDDISTDEFICRASFDDVLRMRHHIISWWISFGTLTMTLGAQVIR